MSFYYSFPLQTKPVRGYRDLEYPFLLHGPPQVIYEVIREIERRRGDDETVGTGYATTTIPLDTVSDKPEKGVCICGGGGVGDCGVGGVSG